jgi:hypothetical protein
MSVKIALNRKAKSQTKVAKKTECYHKGSYKNDLKHGYGKSILWNGSKYEGIYS